MDRDSVVDTRRTFLQSLAAGCAGTVVLSGQAAAAPTTVTVTGGGRDIWDTTDQFHFYHEAVEGNFDVTVRVTELDDTSEWAKAGIMVRQQLTPNAENVMLRYTPSGRSSLQWRADDGDETDSTTSDDVGVGAIEANWLRLVRDGDTITGYGSTDGSDWTRIGRLTSDDLDMSPSTSVGLAVTSHNRGTLCSASFDNLSGLSPSENEDIGDVAQAGSVSTQNGGGGGNNSGGTGKKTPLTPGTYSVRNGATDQALTVANGAADNGATLVQQPDEGKPSQQWTVEALDDGTYRLSAVHSGKVADVSGRSTAPGADVLQWEWHGHDNQRWRIESDGDSLYRLTAAHSGYVMAVAGESAGANVQQQESGSGDAQRWRFEAVDAGGGSDDGEERTVEPTSQFGLDAGFADPAPWLNDDTNVIRVTEPTRDAVETAVSASGPRVVVFETSGTIDLGGGTLRISEDQCWVAGQTAPSPGITFVNGMVAVDANDCVVQHIRSRIGPGQNGTIQGNDSLNTQDGTQNNVVDHVTASWGTDECLSVGYQTSDTTFTNNLIYEGLYDPYGDGTDHNYGTLVGDNADTVTLAGNVWAKCRSRMPRLKGGTRSVVVNNLCYFFDEGGIMDDSSETSFVGNAYLGSTATGDNVLEGGTAYLEDNVAADPSLDDDTEFYGSTPVDTRPLWPDGLSAMSSADVEAHNLANAGARPADRTANDQRIVSEIRDRAGNDSLDSPYDYWIPAPDAVGGYPDVSESTHSLSVPDTGLREWLGAWAQAVEDPDASPP